MIFIRKFLHKKNEFNTFYNHKCLAIIRNVTTLQINKRKNKSLKYRHDFHEKKCQKHL